MAVKQEERSDTAIIRTIYRHHSAGGLLHVVLDDWNIGDDIVEWCDGHVDEKAQEWGDEPEMVAACRELAPLLRGMNEAERASALAYAHGFVPQPEGAADA
ncbi:hypothetical protein [Streptomyces griseorubiginosus]|uniref:hypothetical protein n=1 Tax=Streptomyces griseorubiginosus TaxID=67304 RepID=UPI00331FC779